MDTLPVSVSLERSIESFKKRGRTIISIEEEGTPGMLITASAIKEKNPLSLVEEEVEISGGQHGRSSKS